MDFFTRYRGLSRAERIIKVLEMAREIFARLERFGGLSREELRQVAEGLTRAYESESAGEATSASSNQLPLPYDITAARLAN